MNDRQQAHIDHCLRRLEYWQERNPTGTTPRLTAASDADAAHPLYDEEECAQVIEHLRRLESVDERPAGFSEFWKTGGPFPKFVTPRVT